jgi:hypothetical protein
MLERDTSVSISRATMDGWMMRVGDLLIPVATAIGRELLSGSYVQADETPVPVQMSDKRGKHHRAYLWQYSRPGGSAFFDFRMGRGREGPVKFLGSYKGILQTDGYTAYDRAGGVGMVHAACWAHYPESDVIQSSCYLIYALRTESGESSITVNHLVPPRKHWGKTEYLRRLRLRGRTHGGSPKWLQTEKRIAGKRPKHKGRSALLRSPIKSMLPRLTTSAAGI